MNDDTTWSIRRAERASAAHALGARLAHDLGTPLNVILGRASLIADDPEAPEELRKHAEVITKQVRALHGHVNAFIGAVRATYEDLPRAHTELAPIAEAASREVEGLAGERRTEVVVDDRASGSARLEPQLAIHAVSAALAHAITLATGPVHLTTDVVEVTRPQARRCAPGRYGRFVIEAPVAGSAEGDADLALAASEGSLRFLGGYLGIENAPGKLRYEIHVPTR